MQPERSIPTTGTKASDLQELSSRIRYARRTADLTQRELATILGFTERALRNYERGVREPKRAKLEEIAAATGIDVDWLHTGKTDEREQVA